MPYPKVSKYVKDGEVDPGIQAVAEEIISTFAFWEVDWQAAGISDATVADEIQKYAYFVAASGYGIFTPKAFSKVMEARGSIHPKLKFVLPKYWEAAALHQRPSSIVTFWKEPPWAPWPSVYDPAHKSAKLAAQNYRNLVDLQPDGEMIVEALMFLDPTGAFVGEIQASSKPVEMARDVALKVASAVPPIGRKWLTAKLVTNGVPASKASSMATDIYESGSNLLAWTLFDERAQAVRDILVRFDPNVSDQQVESVARSPLTLSAIGLAFSAMSPATEPSAPSTPAAPTSNSGGDSGGGGGGVTGTTVIAAAGAGALAGFALGGPIGIAVGAGVLLLSSLLSGKN